MPTWLNQKVTYSLLSKVKKNTGQEIEKKEAEVEEEAEAQEEELEVEPQLVHQREQEANNTLILTKKNSHLYERVYFKSTFER